MANGNFWKIYNGNPANEQLPQPKLLIYENIFDANKEDEFNINLSGKFNLAFDFFFVEHVPIISRPSIAAYILKIVNVEGNFRRFPTFA